MLPSLPLAWRVLLVAAVTLAVTIPSGIGLARARKLSPRWFLFIHLGVPFVFVSRRLLHVHWHWIPLFVLCYFTGLQIGKRLATTASAPVRR